MRFNASLDLKVSIDDSDEIDLFFVGLGKTAVVTVSDVVNNTDDWQIMCEEYLLPGEIIKIQSAISKRAILLK